MINPCFISAVGALADPEAIQKSRVTSESVHRVVAKLEPADAQRFVQDLRTYDRDGERSDFLLGILAVAAGEFREGDKPVAIFKLRSNVVGMVFDDPHNGGTMMSA